MKKILFTLLALLSMGHASAQNGGISPEMLSEIRKACPATAETRALRNALAGTSINQLALAAENPALTDTYFSNEVPSKGVTDQKSSGRCWLFTGLNVFRARMIKKYELGKFEFSQSYCFFYDQLEKANLFLQATIDNAKKPMDDKTVEWLFKNPLSDGGQFTGISDLISKYGVVPAGAMPETFNSNNTSIYSRLLSEKLREYGLTLRQMAADGAKPAALANKKQEMLATVHSILVRCFGMPPEKFTWTRVNSKGKPVDTREYTPLSFYKEYVDKDLKGNYLMFMNDPSREFYKTYEIDLDRHAYLGKNWTFVNVPIEDIKEMAIKSIKDSTMMYMSCDVGQYFDRARGYSDPGNFCYADLLGTDFPMDKKDRIRTFASASTHAMTLMAVDLDQEGKPRKWMVENSWGADSGYKGHIIMSDRWFSEYVFRLVVEKQYVPEKLLRLSAEKPTKLPAWDPLFAPEQ